MAARPNTKRTLEYGVRIAENHCERLDLAIAQAEAVIEENQVLTAAEVRMYRESVKAAKQMKKHLLKVTQMTLPKGDTATPRRGRGRPSKKELKQRAAERKAAKTRARKRKTAKTKS